MAISNDIQRRAVGILRTFQLEIASSKVLTPDARSPTLGTASPYPHAPETTIDVGEFTRWLDERVTVKGLGESTALCYRKWVAGYLEDRGHNLTAELRAWIPPSRRAKITLAARDVDNVLLNDVSANRLFVESSKRNQRYLSFISASVLDALLVDLMPVALTEDEERNPSRNRIASMETAMWFMCTLWTGLRPHEWPYARYLEQHYDPDTSLTQRNVLEVKTLKQSGRREDNPLKEKRYLVLDRWPEKQISALKYFLDMVYRHEDADAFHTFYERRRKLLQRAWRRVLAANVDSIEHLGAPLNPSNSANLKRLASSTSSPALLEGNSLSFYTARHAFAEEARRSGDLSQFEIAAVLGHSMITNQSYYGPRSSTLAREHDFCLPKPWPGDADAIELWDRTANPLRGKFMNREDLSESILDIESKNRDRDATDGVSSFWLGL